MINPHQAHVARPRRRGTGSGVPVPPKVVAEALRRLQDGESLPDVRRWLWAEHGLVLSPTAINRWRQP